MYKAKGIRDKKGKLVGGAYMMKNRAGDQAITAETGASEPASGCVYIPPGEFCFLGGGFAAAGYVCVVPHPTSD